jgi:hypothetical protein
MTASLSVSIPCCGSCGLHTHFKPEGKPAPPRPRRPEALISEMICTCQHIPARHVVRSYPVVALEQNLLGLVPVAVFHGALDVRAMVAVQVLEDPVLVLQAAICPHGVRVGVVYCRQGPLLCARRGGGRKAGGSRSRGQGSVGGRAECRRCGGVSCEHRECCCGVDGRN